VINLRFASNITLGTARAPCEVESLENYQQDAIREILKGNFKESMKDFKSDDGISSKHAFEEAEDKREN
jgi:excinuclease ABC subunit C